MGGLDDESDEEPGNALQYKFILLGDGTVGKTSLALRFTDDSFNKSYKQTIGLDFFVKQLSLPDDVNVTVQLWDIGGQTIGGKMISNYIFGSTAVLLVYDITNHQSFANLEDWLALVRRTFKDGTMPLTALIANKADLTHMRSVKPEDHNRFADDNELYSYFVSAKTGDAVSSAFYRIAADLAGVQLTKPEVEVLAKPVTAEIVDHPNKDRSPPPKAGGGGGGSGGGGSGAAAAAAGGARPAAGGRGGGGGASKKCVVM